MTIWYWIFFYVVPAAIAVYLTRIQSVPRNRVLTMHTGVIASILLISILGIRLNWDTQTIPVVIALVAILISVLLLQAAGVAYAVSSVIQEVCILLAGVLVAPVVGLPLGATGTALVYALAHQVDFDNWQWKLPLMFLWGTTSIFLYAYLQQPLINIALHAAGGSVLIYLGFLYPDYKKIPGTARKGIV